MIKCAVPSLSYFELDFIDPPPFLGGFFLPECAFSVIKQRKRGKYIMKNRIFAVILTVTAMLFAITSCSYIFGDVAEQGDVTIVVENTDGSYEVYKTYLENVENKKEGAKWVVENLRDREDNPLNLEMVDGSYGAYVSGIGSIKEDLTSKMYIIVYTSLASDSYEGAPTVDYEGVTLYQAGVGLSGMAVEAGGIILFRLEKSPY